MSSVLLSLGFVATLHCPHGCLLWIGLPEIQQGTSHSQPIRFARFDAGEVRESWTSDVGQSQSSRSLPQARIVDSGNENGLVSLLLSSGILSQFKI